MDDFIRSEPGSGKTLLMRVMPEWKPSNAVTAVHARFSTWSHIRLAADCPLSGHDSSCLTSPAGRMQVILRQAYHPVWNAPGCDTYSSMRGNLRVDCPASPAREGPIEWNFRETTRPVAARIHTRTRKTGLPVTA